MAQSLAIVFISGSSAADVLGGIGRAFRDPFERLGYKFVEVNFTKPDAPALLNNTIAEHSIHLAFSFIGVGMDLAGAMPDGRSVNLWEGLGVPYISLYGDSPAYFFDRHVMPSRRCACLYGFPEHYHLRKQLPEIKGLLGTIPPSVLDAVPRSSVDFLRKESGKVVFLKNGNDPQRLVNMWRAELPESIFMMITDLASDLLSTMNDPAGNDIDARVRSYFLDKSVDIESLLTLRLFFIAQLDDYLRRVKSTLIAESLLDFPIEVHGDKWEHVRFQGRRATLIRGGDYAKSRNVIADCLALLDMSPNTGLAPHDRPLRAMGAYTLFLTNEQRYFSDHFPEHRAFSFTFDKEALQEKVADVIARPKDYVSLGLELAEMYRKESDSDGIARFLLDVADCLRLGSSPRFPGLQDYFAWPPEKLR